MLAHADVKQQQPELPDHVGITGPFSGPYADPGSAIRERGGSSPSTTSMQPAASTPQIAALPEDDTWMPRQACRRLKAAQREHSWDRRRYCSVAIDPRSDTLHRTATSFITAESATRSSTEQGYDTSFAWSAVTIGSARGRELHEGLAQGRQDAIMARQHHVRQKAWTTRPSSGSVHRHDGDVLRRDHTRPEGLTAALEKSHTKPDVLFYTGYYPEFGLLAKDTSL